jgi:hypothetical protein
MSVTVEHKGMSIRWSDNEDQWTCMEMGASSPSLSSIKRKIDAFRRKERKGASVAALYLSNYGSRSMPCEIVEYLGKKGNGSFQREKVATIRSSVSDKPSRNEDNMSDIALDNDVNRASVEQAKLLSDRASELEKQAREIMSSIPRITRDDIAALVLCAGPELETS